MVPVVSRIHAGFAASTFRFTAFRALLIASLAAGVQVQLSTHIASFRFAMRGTDLACAAMGHSSCRLPSLRSPSLAAAIIAASSTASLNQQ